MDQSGDNSLVFRGPESHHDGMRPEGPVPELLSFLIADIRGYTAFTQDNGDEAAGRLAARFAAIAREGIEAFGGRLLELRGDEALAVFTSARASLRAAVALQQVFADETRLDPSLPLKVGMGLDAGEVVPVEGGYRGGAINLTTRLCSLAKAGEALASEGEPCSGPGARHANWSDDAGSDPATAGFGRLGGLQPRRVSLLSWNR